MNNYQFCAISTEDEAYGDAIAYSLPAYDAPPLSHLRQAFPAFIAAYRHSQIVAVCGFRSGRGGLLLEQFMSEPAEHYLASHGEAGVPRTAIVELGAYRVKSPALTPLFSAQIDRLLVERGFTHALALSSSEARSVEEWTRERTAIAGKPSSGGKAAPLQVSVMPLEPRA